MEHTYSYSQHILSKRICIYIERYLSEYIFNIVYIILNVNVILSKPRVLYYILFVILYYRNNIIIYYHIILYFILHMCIFGCSMCVSIGEIVCKSVLCVLCVCKCVCCVCCVCKCVRMVGLEH